MYDNYLCTIIILTRIIIGLTDYWRRDFDNDRVENDVEEEVVSKTVSWGKEKLLREAIIITS